MSTEQMDAVRRPRDELYQHYKGGFYRMICIATNEATGIRMVIYQGQDGENWARPYAEFFGLTDDGQQRFTRVKT